MGDEGGFPVGGRENIGYIEKFFLYGNGDSEVARAAQNIMDRLYVV